MTFSVSLNGQSWDALQAEAAKIGVPVETLARSVLENFATTAPSPMAPQDRRALFEKAKADSLRENDGLYRRLAQ